MPPQCLGATGKSTEIGLVWDKEDLLEPMLEDPKLAERLVNEQEALVRVSPYLMFAVLLRRVRRDLEGQSFVLERDARGKRIPVFEAPEAVQLLGDPAMREYLTQMLCSFVGTLVSRTTIIAAERALPEWLARRRGYLPAWALAATDCVRAVRRIARE